MKADPEVKMISAEAPILFAKGCDIFITELTMRAWIHAEENKRRTLQRSDIASALAKSDMFDFLIDIVPREEAANHAKRTTGQTTAPGGPGAPPPAQIPQHVPQQAHQAMPPPDYNIAHGLAPEPDYRQPDAFPTASYGAQTQQMYPEMQGMYGYQPMQAQQVVAPSSSLPSTSPKLISIQQMYQVPPQGQRAHDTIQDPSHNYARHEGDGGDADAEGERDYDVG
jgi:hypothetical protein